MSTLARPRTLRVAGFAAGAVAIAGAAVAVTASAAGFNFNLGGAPSSSTSTAASLSTSPRDAAGTSAVCTDFINHFASDLGTDSTKVDTAFQQALAQTLADEVSAGKLTQKQAEAIKTKLAGKQPCDLGPALKGGGGAHANLGPYMQLVLNAAASALGITPDELKADLQKGESLSQIAAAQNPPVTEDQFRQRLIANLTPALDQAVKDGKLTADQEQKILQRLKTGPIPFWDKAPKAATAAGATT
jgi:hypothetical protein